MKRHRRHREHIGSNTFSVASTHANGRIHDFLKGWGTIAKDGKSILWDTYRPATKKQRDKLDRHWKKNPPFTKIMMPLVNQIFPEISAKEFLNVQPMVNPFSKNV